MLKGALDFLGGNVGDGGGGSSFYSGSGNDDPLVGSIVDVGGTKVVVKRRIGEGGFAFVYEASDMENPLEKKYALKRLLAMDLEKKNQIVREISILKTFSDHNGIVRFVTAASVTSKGREEFLVLMEYCPYVLSQVLLKRKEPFEPGLVARIFVQVVDAVSVLHSSNPPIIHRDLKLENLLIDQKQRRIKLCDFGSATTEVFRPNDDWTMAQRTQLEEDMALHTTPMYRSPEMLDTWSNYPIDTAADIWALGCLLFTLCFRRHPFEDSNKLAIFNGNYKIPANDVKYKMFHDLIGQMLTVDPTLRPTCSQILQHLTSVSLSNGIDPTLDLDLDLDSSSPVNSNGGGFPDSNSASSSHTPSPQHQGAGLMSSLRGGAGSFMTKIKDKSQSVIQTVQHSMAARELDLHCITEKVAAMSFPADGIESAFKNHIDDVSMIVEGRHSNRYMVMNLSERTYNTEKFPTGRVCMAGWKTNGLTPLHVVMRSISQAFDFLQHTDNVIVIHCLDGKSNTAVLVAGILMAVGFVTSADDALKFFSLKRCDAVLSNHHKTTLKYLEQVFVTSPVPSLEVKTISVKSVILEPTPLFSKNQDGCKPYVELTTASGVAGTLPSSVDFGSLKSFTGYDEEVTLWSQGGVKVSGDVQVSAFHARQTLGSFLSANKFDSLLMCKAYFHTGFLPSSGSSIKFRVKELDGLDKDDQRVAGNFKLVVNYHLDKSNTVAKLPVHKSSTKYSLGLIFSSQAEHESNSDMMREAGGTTEEIPVAPPRSTSKKTPVIPEVAVEPQVEAPVVPPRQPPVKAPEVKPVVPQPGMARPAGDTLLLDLSVGNKSPVIDNAFSTTSPATNSESVKDLLNISKPDNGEPDLFNKPEDTAPSDLLLGDFAAPPGQQPKSSSDLLGDIPDFHDKKKGPMLNPNTTPTPTFTENLVDDFLQGLPSKEEPKKASSNNGGPKPNYNSAFFHTAPPPTSNVGVNKKVSPGAFNDLLGGFSATSIGGNEPKTIGEMKKKEEMKYMSGHEAKVFKWKDGKTRNIRALLCSLDTVVWEGSRWTKCGMHQLVTQADVKKMYRKACLAVHPDKQVGTDNEELSKLIFMELNDAWSEFDKT